MTSIVSERRMACVIVTHNKKQAERIALRTMIMRGGPSRRTWPDRGGAPCGLNCKTVSASDVMMGLAQAAAAIMLCLAVVLLCRVSSPCMSEGEH